MPVKTPGEVKDVELVGSWFAVKLDNGIEGLFTDASGFGYEMEVVETTVATPKGDTRTQKRPGKPKYSEVTLKRGFTTNKVIHDWFNEVVEATKETPYKTASIVIYDRQQTECGRFNLEGCWPSKMSVSDLTAGSDDVMVEELTIQHEFLDWTKPT